MRTHTLTAALLFVGLQSVRAQSGTTPPSSVTSSWRIVRDSRGNELRRELTNRSFAFAFRYIRTKPTDLLFTQEIRTIKKVSQEGDNGRVRIEAWASVRPDTGYRRRLWAADMDGSAARLLPDYYETIEFGCCGTFDTRTLLSLETGRPIVSLTTGPVSIRGGAIGDPSSQRPVNVVYLSSMGTRPVGRGRADSLAFGELLLVEGDSVLSRVVLRVEKRDLDPLASVQFAFQAGHDSVSEGGLFIQAGTRPAAHIYSDAWKSIVIPLDGKRFVLAGATLPRGIKAELVQSR